MRDAIHALGERLDQLANRIATNADDTRDALTVLDDATEVVRYGLMEFGGFVRNQSLTGQQRTICLLRKGQILSYGTCREIDQMTLTL